MEKTITNKDFSALEFETLVEMLPKLVRSYAIDAIESVHAHRRNPGIDSARDFMSRLARAEVETYPAVGLGTEVRMSAPGVIAGGLVVEERIVHLAAFSSTAATIHNNEEGIARKRFRRRFMRR